jgi:hypothetical protein
MNNDFNEIEYQSCNISNAMLRNVNDNFISVSFDFLSNRDIIIKVVLKKKTVVEDSYIEDMIAEFTAVQKSDCVQNPLVEVGYQHAPLQNLVYQQES